MHRSDKQDTEYGVSSSGQGEQSHLHVSLKRLMSQRVGGGTGKVLYFFPIILNSFSKDQ